MQINEEIEYEIRKEPMRKTQKGFIEHFNKIGLKMIGPADFYDAAANDRVKTIQSLAKDLNHYVMTSAQINYDKKSEYAEITQDAGSTVVNPKSFKAKISYFDGEVKEENIELEECFQTLFQTKHKLPEILKNIRKYGKDKIYFWTPSQSSRASQPLRSVVLYFINSGFYVTCDIWLVDVGGFGGVSRGVNVQSSEAAQTSESDAQ